MHIWRVVPLLYYTLIVADLFYGKLICSTASDMTQRVCQWRRDGTGYKKDNYVDMDAEGESSICPGFLCQMHLSV
jgi:hypothetical protein